MIKLEKGMRVLFQGDSITDAGRDREDLYNLGGGYAVLVAAYLNSKYPELELEFINKGVACECTVDMVKRWDKDTIELKPDVLTFMGGVNDSWRRYDGADTITTAEEYEKNLRTLIEESKKAGIKNIVLMEPYLTMNDEGMKLMLEEDLADKQKVVRKLAKEYNTEFVPLQDIFNEAQTKRLPDFWTQEGVHPKWPGCGLIAQNLLKVFGYEI